MNKLVISTAAAVFAAVIGAAAIFFIAADPPAGTVESPPSQGVSYIEVFLDPGNPPGSHPVGINPLDVIAGR